MKNKIKAVLLLSCFLLTVNIYAGKPRCKISLDTINSNSETYIKSALILSKLQDWSIGNTPQISKIRTDKSVALKFVQARGDNYKFLSASLKMDKDIILMTIEGGSDLPYNNINKISVNRDYLLKIIEADRYGFSIENFPRHFKEDKSIVLKVIKANAWNISDKTLAAKFKDDKDVALATLNGHRGMYFEFSERIKNDPEIIRLVADDMGLFSGLSKKIQNIKEFALLGIKGNGWLSQELTKKFLLDPDFKSDFIDNCWSYSPEQLKKIIKTRKDKLKTLSRCSYFYLEMDDADKNDTELLLQSIKSGDEKFFKKLPKELQKDESFIKLALTVNGEIYKALEQYQRNNREWALIAVASKAKVLKNLSKKFKNDKEIVLTALKNDPDVLQYASSRLKDDKDIVQVAIRKDGLSLKHASARWKNDKDTVTQAIKTNYLLERFSSPLEYASKRLQQDEALQILAFQEEHLAFGMSNIKLANRKVVKKYIEKKLRADVASSKKSAKSDCKNLKDNSKSCFKRNYTTYQRLSIKLDEKVLRNYFKGTNKQCFNALLPLHWSQSDLKMIKVGW